ncbi:MAG: hypothetical protein WCF93_03090 [Candidatus Moraniibacteriota bacterium]
MKKLESFFWGIIAAVGAGVVQFIFFILFSIFTDPAGKLSYGDFFSIPVFILVIAFVEEFFKFLMLARRITGISSKKTFFYNALLMGLGFFFVEFLLIIISITSATSFQSITEIALLHLSTTAFLSYFIFTANSKKISSAVFAVLTASIFHGAYNFCISQANVFADYLAIIILTALIFIDLVLFLRLGKELAQD